MPLVIFLFVLVSFGAIVLLGPTLLWMYHTESAGRLLKRGLVWPQPHSIDALPMLADDAAAAAALSHLHMAAAWRHDMVFTQRQMAQVYAARKEWRSAAEILGQIHTKQPRNTLLAWEYALMQEQLLKLDERAPRESIIADLLSVPVEAPSEPIATTYCEPGNAAACYVAFDRFTQAYAGDPTALEVQLDSLVMYPPSAVKLTRPIYADHAVLDFAIGLDPNMRAGRTDGATFEIWLTGADAMRQRVWKRDVERDAARSGWLAANVDLSAWAGQVVTLEFRTTGGAAGDTSDDWYAWGDVSMTTADAASINRFTVEQNVRELWHQVGIGAQSFVQLGDASLARGDVAAADSWYQRSLRANPQQAADVHFRAHIAAIAHGSGQDVPREELDLLVLESRLSIPAPSLRWLRDGAEWGLQYGDRLGDHFSVDPNVGVFWWGGTAVAVVDVQRSGSYRVAIHAQHSAPAPIELQIEDNLKQLGVVSFDRGSGEWGEAAVTAELDRGLHVLGLRFLNDVPQNGQDRNAAIRAIEIEAIN